MFEVNTGSYGSIIQNLKVNANKALYDGNFMSAGNFLALIEQYELKEID